MGYTDGGKAGVLAGWKAVMSTLFSCIIVIGGGTSTVDFDFFGLVVLFFLFFGFCSTTTGVTVGVMVGPLVLPVVDVLQLDDALSLEWVGGVRAELR